MFKHLVHGKHVPQYSFVQRSRLALFLKTETKENIDIAWKSYEARTIYPNDFIQLLSGQTASRKSNGNVLEDGESPQNIRDQEVDDYSKYAQNLERVGILVKQLIEEKYESVSVYLAEYPWLQSETNSEHL